MRTTTIIRLTAGAALTALAACSDINGHLDDADAQPEERTCTELVGTPTDEFTTAESCVNEDGELELTGFAFYDCPDGRRLSWNDRGWGYSGGTWQAHNRPDGQIMPPDADLNACQTPLP